MERETDDVAAGVLRLISALGRRVGSESPEELAHLARIDRAVGENMRRAVNGLREQGFTDVHIGEVLGVTRQAVQQRWPR